METTTFEPIYDKIIELRDTIGIRTARPVLIETVHYSDGTKQKKKHRLFLSDDMVCTYCRNSSSYGWRFEPHPQMVSMALKWTDPHEEWVKTWSKVADKLQCSGLWPDIYQNVLNGLKAGYDEVRRKEPTHPLLLNPNGEINTFFPYHMTRPAKIKSMYFGKYNNKTVKDRIQQSLATKTEYYSSKYRTSYDVSFEYDGNIHAWYSEEYKGCGNGHYYIALDANSALFMEND